MTRSTIVVAAILAAALVLPMAPEASAWTGTIVCESHRYRRNFCRVDTQGWVRLQREISTGNLCRQGRSWGFDDRGIWVDRGCRGVFEFGRRGSRSNNNAGAAIAAGVIGSLVGSAISSQNNNPPPVAHIAVPAWAVGSFQGWDPEARQIAQLIVSSNGRTLLRDERGTVVRSGVLRDGMVFWDNGRRSWIAREDPGVMLGDVETGRHFNFRRS